MMATKKTTRIIGIIILLLVLIANLQYAFSGYGICCNVLVNDVLDQTNSASAIK